MFFDLEQEPIIDELDGTKYWLNGKNKLVIDNEGCQFTYKDNNQLHSFNDEPAVIYPKRYKGWYKDDKLHRDNDLPAQQYFQDEIVVIEIWAQNGRFHRTTGPAVVYSSSRLEYWINGILLTKEEFNNQTT